MVILHCFYLSGLAEIPKLMKSKKIKLKGPSIGHVQNLTESQEAERRLKQIIIKALFQPQIHQRQLLD